jgi:hypothetical protein
MSSYIAHRGLRCPSPGQRLDPYQVEPLEGRVLLAVTVTFPDSALEAAVRAQLAKPTGTITSDDMARVTTLTDESDNIQDLTGLEYATNLTQLDVYDNFITDLTPLAGLTHLTQLDATYNLVADVTPLSNVNSLSELYLGQNFINDTQPLSNLNNLSILDLGLNNISDLTPLSNLTGLGALGLYDNLITDLTPLSGMTQLQVLLADGNQLQDISSLSGMTQMTDLELYDNQITDLAPVAGMTQLDTLLVDGNHISNLAPIGGLTHLTQVSLENNYLDISGSPATTGIIQALAANGAAVTYVPQALPPGDAVVHGGTGDNHFTLSAPDTDLEVVHTPGPTDASYVAPLADLTSFTLTGGPGNDTVDFNGPFALPINFAGGGGNDVLNVNSGDFSTASDLGAATASLTVNVLPGATAFFGAGQHLAALNVSGAAFVGPGRDKPLVVNGLSIAPGAELDLYDNSMIVNYTGPSPEAAIQQYAKDAVANHNASGLFASAGNDPSFSKSGRTLAVFDNHDAHLASLSGQPLSPDYNQVLIKYTYYGDANVDGKVDPTDYAAVDGNQGKGHNWVTGDLNFDGKVDPTDYAQIDGNQGAGYGIGGNDGGPQLSSLPVEPVSSPALSPTPQRTKSRNAPPRPAILYPPTSIFSSAPLPHKNLFSDTPILA